MAEYLTDFENGRIAERERILKLLRKYEKEELYGEFEQWTDIDDIIEYIKKSNNNLK
jgi:hypothetical protein